MESFLRTLSDQTVNGLVLGNIYALIAVGLALIFGVGNLINFAQGSVFMIGAYTGWVCITWWNLPLLAAFVVVASVCALVGILIERFALRPLQQAPPIAPLLATIAISFVLDQLVQIGFTRNPQSFPSPLPPLQFQVGGVTVGTIDLLIAATSLTAAASLYLFLRYSRMGWALRATAQDRDAARQMGVDVDGVNRTTFAIASALGGIAGLLIGLYYSTVYPTMSFQAGVKGFAAVLLGGLGNVPGAVLGGLSLGLIESYGVALFGATYRNLFAYVILVLVLVFRPNGLFTRGRRARTADRHLYQPQPPCAGPPLVSRRPHRSRAGAASVCHRPLPAPVADQWLADGYAGAQRHAGDGNSRADLAGPGGLHGARRLYVGAVDAAAALAVRAVAVGGGGGDCRPGDAVGPACLPTAGAIHRHCHTRHWRNRQPGDSQLGLVDQWCDGHQQYCPAFHLGDRSLSAASGLLVCARPVAGERVAAMAAGLLAAGAHLARHSRG